MRRASLFLVLLAVVSFFGLTASYPAVLAASPTRTPAPTVPAMTPIPLNTPWLKVYFTNPDVTADTRATIDKTVASVVLPVLNAAKTSIDVASFDFNLPEVVTALVNAKKRGVTVRVVLDAVNGTHILKAGDASGLSANFTAIQPLQDAGITVVNGGRSNGLMHNKMIIVDGSTLFMGSWNMSYNDSFRNNNNLLQITSQKLIANYQAKFNELFVNKKFGTKAVVKALNPQLTLDGTAVENYFSPPDKVMDKIIAQVNGAKKSIKFMAFTYTHSGLANAMIARANAGVQVQGVIENRGASQGAMVPLFCAGLPIKTDGNKYTMHHKVIIIDDQTVITGSFNFTQTADTANDDNILVIHNASVAALYNQEFARVYGAGVTPAKTDITCSTTF